MLVQGWRQLSLHLNFSGPSLHARLIKVFFRGHVFLPTEPRLECEPRKDEKALSCPRRALSQGLQSLYGTDGSGRLRQKANMGDAKASSSHSRNPVLAIPSLPHQPQTAPEDFPISRRSQEKLFRGVLAPRRHTTDLAPLFMAFTLSEMCAMFGHPR